MSEDRYIAKWMINGLDVLNCEYVEAHLSSGCGIRVYILFNECMK